MTARSHELDDRVAVVTGASRGIGRAIALGLAAAGAAVALVGRDDHSLAATKRQIEGAGGQAAVHVTDLADGAAHQRLIAAVADRWHCVDILVNNAGVAPPEPTARSDDFSAWEALLRVNLNAVFRLTRLCGRMMLAKGDGSIINIGSVAGDSALIAAQPGYCATKAALNGLTKALAVEWAPHNVRVNTIAPGYIATEMNAAARKDKKFVGSVKARTPMGRFGTPEEIAAVAVFLASPASSYVTGQTWSVDGGWSAL